MAHRHVSVTIFLLIVLLRFIVELSSAGANDPRYLGCYKDDISFRASGWDQFTSSVTISMTINVCAAVCMQQRTALSGLTNGNECWCTNTTVFNRTNCAGCCEVPCQGNRGLKCGGRNAFGVFQSVVDSRYLGCYQDQHFSRIFPNRIIIYDHDNSSVDHCIQRCGQQKFGFAGIQWQQCWCGNKDYNKHGRCISEQNCECNLRCSGNHAEICGGYYAVSLFRTECREHGKWGADCQKTCRCNNGAPCNISTGKCPNNECSPGWTGLSCNEECETGSFGYYCAYECQCANSEDCDKITGKCQNDKNILVPTLSSLLGVAVLIIGTAVAVFLCRNTKGKNLGTPRNQCHGEEPYHLYDYITHSVQVGPPVENVRQLPSAEAGTRSKQNLDYIEMNQNRRHSHYVNNRRQLPSAEAGARSKQNMDYIEMNQYQRQHLYTNVGCENEPGQNEPNYLEVIG